MDEHDEGIGRSNCRPDRWLVAAIGLAVAVRAALALSPQVGGNALRLPDLVSYDFAARSLLERGEIWFSTAQRAKREPGYPLFVAGCYAVFGRRPVAVRLTQALIGALLCWPMYALARRVGGRRAGRAAALIAALYPYLALASVLVLTEVLYTVLLWLALWATTGTEAERRGTVVAGATWAALVAVRSEALVLFLAVAAVALVVSPRRRALAPRLTAGLIGLVLIAGLWAWRNRRVVGHPVFTTLNVGETLYDGLWSGADGSSNKAFMRDLLVSEGWSALDEVARDGRLRRMALAYARAHPGHVLRLAARKVARTWSPVPNVSTPSCLLDAILGGAFVVVVLGGLFGCVLHRHLWRTWVVWLVPVGVMTAARLVVVGSIRYRIPVIPFFVVMAGAGFARRRMWND